MRSVQLFGHDYLSSQYVCVSKTNSYSPHIYTECLSTTKKMIFPLPFIYPSLLMPSFHREVKIVPIFYENTRRRNATFQGPMKMTKKSDWFFCPLLFYPSTQMAIYLKLFPFCSFQVFFLFNLDFCYLSVYSFPIYLNVFLFRFFYIFIMIAFGLTCICAVDLLCYNVFS